MTLRDQLDQIARLEEKATPGKLEFVNTEIGVSYNESYGLLKEDGHPSGISAERFIDAEFIAALVNWYRSGGRELAEDGMRYRWMKAHKGDWYAWAMRTAGTNNLDAAIDVARWNRSFESERREVYVKRDEIVAARAKEGK